MKRKLMGVILAGLLFVLAVVIDVFLFGCKPFSAYPEIQEICFWFGLSMGVALAYAVKSVSIGLGIGIMSTIFCASISCSQDPLANIALVGLYVPTFALSLLAAHIYLRLFSHAYLLDID